MLLLYYYINYYINYCSKYKDIMVMKQETNTRIKKDVTEMKVESQKQKQKKVIESEN